MRDVYLIGAGWIPVQKANPEPLRKMAAEAGRLALKDARIEKADALYVANMLADALDKQCHLGALIATELGLAGVEALEVTAASASGAAALRAAYLAVASGSVDSAIALGVEKMSAGEATPALSRGLDASEEAGETMVTMNARLMQKYIETYGGSPGDFGRFAVNAHQNALTNDAALFHKAVTVEECAQARIIHAPLRLYDCAPVCDGAAAVVLSANPTQHVPAVKHLASTVATDVFQVARRKDPLDLAASRISAEKAYLSARIEPRDVDFFEVHDAFSIMACLSLEACGFVPRGQGLQPGREGRLSREGDLPLSTFGGLKGRGHPIGATALYQAGEIFLQLTGRAGRNAVTGAKTAMMQSIGGAGSTILTNVFQAV